MFSWLHIPNLFFIYTTSESSLLLRGWPKPETFPARACFRGSGSNWSSLIHCYLISGSGSRKTPSSSFASDGKYSRIDFLLGNLHKMVGISWETQLSCFPRWWSSLFWGHSLRKHHGRVRVSLFLNLVSTQIYLFIHFRSCFVFKLTTTITFTVLQEELNTLKVTARRGGGQEPSGVTPGNIWLFSSGSFTRLSLAELKAAPDCEHWVKIVL